MADTPQDRARCKLCDWEGPMASGDRPVIDSILQDDLVRHHVSAHGFPSPDGQPSWEWLTYDPTEEAVVSLRRTFAGILLVDDGVVRQLEDDHPHAFDIEGPIVRAVLIARLRAWADLLDTPEQS